jgi:glycosyltransferase involved in cell wall biosynthesis
MQRLDPEKAPDVAIRAWAASGLADVGWTLQVAGRGALEPGLRALAAQLDVAGSVSFLGHVVDTDYLLSTAGIFLAPAPLEPFGLSVVEAMAHGLPVVAAAGGGHLETVADDAGLFPPGDIDAAARRLAQLGADDEQRRLLGARLQERQRRLFGLALHVDRLEDCYSGVLQRQRRAA